MRGIDYLEKNLTQVLKQKSFIDSEDFKIIFERPKIAEHGDLATNVAMMLASQLKRKPRDIAHDIVESLKLDQKIVKSVEIAGAGFINFRFGNGYYHNELQEILDTGEKFGKSDSDNKQRIQIEFVSANPTGPLNIVSARAAAVGDVMTNLFAAVGHEVQREYYVNDAGRQVRLLGMSVSARYMELLGHEEPFPEEGYRGDYVTDIAQKFVSDYGDKFAMLASEDRWEQLSDLAVETILSEQKQVLDSYRLNYDNWFSEKTLRASDTHLQVLDKLTKNGFVYEKDGAKWFKSSAFGDEKDRVLVTGEGEPTYFLVDIAYHADKYNRNFSKLYDLWGPDHHGYIPRMKAALLALGFPQGSFEVNIIQQVNLIRDGEIVKMSKRAGKIIEMKELIEEVGVDVARFFFVARRTQSPLDFDMDLAKKTSDENPVYYVQYAHARICNIIKHAAEKGVDFPQAANLELLDKEEELTLIKKMMEFPDIIAKAVEYLEPHRIPNYLQEVAATLHRFYHHHKVVSDDSELTKARLLLIQGAKIVIANALKLLGVTAPERM